MRFPNQVLLLALALGAAPWNGGTSTIPEVDQVSIGSDTPAFEPAPAASRRLKSPIPKDLGVAITNHFASHDQNRLHVQFDRPLYRPGDDIWVKTWSLQTATLSAVAGNISVQLVDPSGAVRETKVSWASGMGAALDFTLPADAPGGRWSLKASLGSTVEEHAFVVSTSARPQIKKELDFLREAYGAGETVQALVELEHGIRGALAKKKVRALVTVDGSTILDQELETDKSGAVLVSATLPQELSAGDGLLTVLVEEGGVTESISRALPIVLAKLDLAFYPEGGDLRTDLLSRVYFEAKDDKGEPADIEGVVVDDKGREVADLRSLHDGLGRFTFTPRAGRSYSARITSPVGIEAPVPLPVAEKKGCVVRSYDDFDSTHEATRVGIRCTSAQDVYVVGVLRNQLLDQAAVRAGPDTEAVVYLQDGGKTQGTMRVTVFDAKKKPLAERLVYRGAGNDLQIDVRTDKATYGPRDQVTVDLQVRDASGKGTTAEIALSVVDDAVVGLADDEEGTLLSRLYLRPELTEAPDDPAWYFDADEPDAREGLDLVMGTKGWRRFDWQPVFNPAPLLSSVASFNDRAGGGVPRAPRMMQAGEGLGKGMGADMEMGIAGGMAQAAPADEPVRIDALVGKPNMPVQLGARAKAKRKGPRLGGRPMAKREARAEDDFWEHNERPAMAPVRSFPTPDYKAGFTGVRSDFRETVHWTPLVTTSADGAGQVQFYLSDAITTFRVTAEGVGSNQAGHAEEIFRSVLPVSVAAKIPAVVSAGDVLDLPLTVTSTRDEGLDVEVHATLGSELLTAKKTRDQIALTADGSGTVWMPLVVGNGQDSVALEVVAEGGGMTDTLQREIQVVQPGFPRAWSRSGELGERQRFSYTLEPHQEGSLQAVVTLQPGPTSTLIEGMEGLIRTPGGCFEQTSSTNWPNVAILNYLEEHDGDPRLRQKSTAALKVGYGRLSGFQVDAGGFETFGSGPGKEVLSAFGLLQFTDMKKVYPVSEKMMDQDVSFLLSRRDGNGGYENSGDSAHGYGSAPKPVSDGFITYALVANGHHDILKKEIEQQAAVGRTTKDPYVLALAARTLVATGHPAASGTLKRLVALQSKDGAFKGAQSSITRSYEANLDVESTALASLALMEAGPTHRAQFDKGAAWLTSARSGGTWGATQATALALGALTKHAALSKAPRVPGDLFVEVNGEQIGHVHYDADQTETIRIDLAEHLKPGKNQIELFLDSPEPLPFSIDSTWTSTTPMTDAGAELEVRTSLASTKLTMGETVRMSSTVSNRTDRIVPSPIARIGIPAGLEAPIWQLKELQDSGQIAFYETRPREVTIYWEGIHPDETHTVNLDLEAIVPGTYTGPATSAYPYYNDDEKAWADGTKVVIARP